jgi:hypothetical protein
MADKKAKPKASASMAAPVDNGNKWQDLLDNLKSGATGPFFFLGDGKTRIRLVPEPDTDDNFFIETVSIYGGKEKSKFIVLGLVMGSSSKDLDPEEANKVRPIILPKTAIRYILSLLAEGWDLLSEDAGHGLTITRTGKGRDTGYTVTNSPKAIPVAYDELEYPESSLEELAQEFYARAIERDSEQSAEEKPAAKKNGKGDARAKARQAAMADDDDEEGEDW